MPRYDLTPTQIKVLSIIKDGDKEIVFAKGKTIVGNTMTTMVVVHGLLKYFLISPKLGDCDKSEKFVINNEGIKALNKGYVEQKWKDDSLLW
jgi:hypothetical protein